MNPLPDRLQPHPFERLNALLASLTPRPLVRRGLGAYPPTRGSAELAPVS